jgi:prolyl-tRNA synthetase
MGCYFLDQAGQPKPVIMGSYGIGSGRLLACIAERHHDKNGLVWPVTIAPYLIHLVVLGKKSSQEVVTPDSKHPISNTHETAEGIYHDLFAKGVEVLFDDRNESPGVKFNDADLIGIPIRLTISDRSLQAGGVEFKRRDQPDRAVIPFDQLILKIETELKNMQDEINRNVVQLPYEG